MFQRQPKLKVKSVDACVASVKHVCDGLDEGEVVLRRERLRGGDGRRRRGDLADRHAGMLRCVCAAPPGRTRAPGFGARPEGFQGPR